MNVLYRFGENMNVQWYCAPEIGHMLACNLKLLFVHSKFRSCSPFLQYLPRKPASQ